MMITYKYRVKDRSAKKALVGHAYACNQVWNWCVALQQDIENRYRAGAKPRAWPSHFDLTKQCKGVGFDLGINQQTVNEVCRQFVVNRNRLKKSPKFRSSFGTGRSMGWIPFQKQSYQVEGNSITYYGKSYRFYSGNRDLPKNTKGGVFVEDSCGHWYVCFHVEVTKKLVNAGRVGIDLGLKAFLTLSTGQKIAPQRIYHQAESKIAIAQRSRNKFRVKAIHFKIRNKRRDFLHKLSTQLARDYALIAVGNVSSKRAALNLAKAANDAGWSTFRQMLKYKAATYVEVDEKFTTQTCSCCGSKDSDMRPRGIAGLGIREWECSDCGVIHDRDVNAAKNILARALSTQRPFDGSLLARAG